MKVIQLSDLHIGKSDNLSKSASIVDWIIEHTSEHQSDLVIISGDLVDDGARWQFKQAAHLLDRLRQNGFTTLVAPGNHDYGPDGFRESKQSQRDFADLISGKVNYPHLFTSRGQAFITLDSMAEEIETMEFWGAQGLLGKDQLQKLDQMLDELAENPAVENVIVILHHHPFDFLFYHGLRDHADLKSVISQRMKQPPRVNCLLFGHKHIERRFNDSDENKEALFGIDLIYAAGSTVERNQQGKMIIPVIDIENKLIERFFID